MSEVGKLKKSLNVVHSDEIWKDHINRELLAQKNWPQKWGFLSEIYTELEKETKNNSRIQCVRDNNANATTTSITDQTSSESKQLKKRFYPKTDSQMIGWKSAVGKRCPYGVPENQARGKCDILKTFDWPQEGQ